MTEYTMLTGHTSPETAYVVDDYPYGFRLRTKIRYWIETKEGFGQRVVSQTVNPIRAGEVWNKPKASTYSAIRVLFLNHDNGHVENDGIGLYASLDDINKFEERYHLALDNKRDQATLRAMRALAERVRVAVAAGVK